MSGNLDNTVDNVFDYSIIEDNPYLLRASRTLEKHLSEYFPEEDLDDLLLGIYHVSVNKSQELKIMPRWDNSKFVTIFNNQLRHNISNIYKNKKTIFKLQNGEINFITYPTIPEFEKNKKKWKKIKEEYEKKEEEELHGITVESSVICPKCKHNEVLVNRAQIRSADEPETFFYKCFHKGCGKLWTGSGG